MKTDIEAIHETGLITDAAAKILRDLAQELEETFSSVQVHRTRTEMEVSVLNDLKFPTPSSKYWQAVREQNGMLQSVTILSFDYREAQVRADMLRARIIGEKSGLKIKLYKIQLERKMYFIKDMKRAAKAKIREIKDWSEIKARESKVMTPVELADVGNHQLISYTQRWINQVNGGGLEGSPSESNNLMGQLKMGLKVCSQRGLMGEVEAPYSPEIRQGISNLIGEK